MGSRGWGVVKPFGEQECFPTRAAPILGQVPACPPPKGRGCSRVSQWVPGAVWGAPGPLHPLGCTCSPGPLVWKALHACRAGKSVPVPEPGPPSSSARAGGSPQSAFVPALERMDWRQPGSAVSWRHWRPRRSGRGKGDRWRDGGTEGQNRCRYCRLWQDLLLCQPADCGTGGTGGTSWGSAHTACTMPALGMCWCHQAPGVVSRGYPRQGWPGTVLQGVGIWKSGPCSGAPSWKKLLWGAGTWERGL